MPVYTQDGLHVDERQVRFGKFDGSSLDHSRNQEVFPDVSTL